MQLRYDGWYNADKGKHFVLTEKGKHECKSYNHKRVGEPVSEYDTEATAREIERGYLIEVDIPNWSKLTGYQVVYYRNGYRLTAGNPIIFPEKKTAEIYKHHYESYTWFDEELFIEEVEYEGVPLSECKIYNGKEVIDKEHYFGLDACEIGSYFTDDMVSEFMDLLPPVCLRSDCSQIGEPKGERLDNNGNVKFTYSTFKKITNDIWEYCGDCFVGENTRYGNEIPYL